MYVCAVVCHVVCDAQRIVVVVDLGFRAASSRLDNANVQLNLQLKKKSGLVLDRSSSCTFSASDVAQNNQSAMRYRGFTLIYTL